MGDQVEVGTYLGDEGDVGCATRSHLHFEVAVPRNPGTNRIPKICDVSGHMLLKGNSYGAAPCRE